VRGIVIPSVYIIGGIVDHKYCLNFLFIITLPAAIVITWSSSEKRSNYGYLAYTFKFVFNIHQWRS